MILTLLRVKNYYDRRAFKYDTLDEYIEAGAVVVDTIYDIDFNPNDDLRTSQVLNTQSPGFDYVIVEEDTGGIVSRWYVMEAVRLRLSQYRVDLLRDIVADKWDSIVGAPAYIEKATLDRGNPLIFNSENMTFNQIKTRETLLKDQSLCPWIVGYIKSDTEATEVSVATQKKYYAEYNSLSEIPYYDYIADGAFKGDLTDINLSIYYLWEVGFSSKNTQVTFNGTSSSYRNFNEGVLGSPYAKIVYNRGALAEGEYYTQDQAGAIIANTCKNFYSNRSGNINDIIRHEYGIADASETASFLQTYNTRGTILKVADTYYEVKLQGESIEQLKANPNSNTSELYNAYQDIVAANRLLNEPTDIPDVENFETTGNYVQYKVSIAVVQDASSYKLSIPAAGQRMHLQDSPYDMFAIPYNFDTRLSASYTDVADVIRDCNSEAALAIATKISAALGKDQFIDLQLLPYCPIRGVFGTTPGTLVFDAPNYELNRDYSYIYDTTGDPGDPKEVSVLFWCTESSFSFKINRTWRQLRGGDIETKSLVVFVDDPKVEGLCDKYRLSSPNYSSQFEFNAAMNTGIDYYKVDCTYKPYAPYVRVAPNFKGLYGAGFGDARGLILSGDFSLPTISDAWTEYQINNKNYINAFDRQVENLEVQHKYQRQADIWGAATGTVSAATGGAMTGSMVGGGYGAAAGALLAGGVSAAGGIADVRIADALRRETIDYTRDQFGFALGNIQALPYTLNKVSAFNVNNRFFPVLEYYTCTEIEKEALRNKIKYNGMTVGTIGTISEYIRDEETYIKGKLIRLGDINEDFHIASALAEEINKGVFI